MTISRLVLVTFSGAHCTGKTTLLSDLARTLMQKGLQIGLAASCSSRLFERICAGEIPVPGGVLPENYDDLNRLGLRTFFQEKMPDSLAFEVEAVVDALSRAQLDGTLFMLVDRWFPDIYAYTLQESSDPALHARLAELCRSRYDDLMRRMETLATKVSMLNVVVPVGSCHFKAGAQAEKFRATGDRQDWEDLCLGNWNETVRDQNAQHIITDSKRRSRVNSILEALQEEPIDRLPPTPGKRPIRKRLK